MVCLRHRSPVVVRIRIHESGVAVFSSTALGFLRCAIASVVLYAVLRCKGVRMLSWRELPRFTLSGALGFSIYLFIFNKGSETLTAATGCILIATAPIITAYMVPPCQ